MLEWNVLVGDFNSGTIKIHNVFDHWSLMEDLGKTMRRLNRNKELSEDEKKAQFLEELRRDMMYYYWSKCEWEVIVSHWPQSERCKDEKIDVYDQVRMNWDLFCEYVWEHRKEIAKRKKT